MRRSCALVEITNIKSSADDLYVAGPILVERDDTPFMGSQDEVRSGVRSAQEGITLMQANQIAKLRGFPGNNFVNGELLPDCCAGETAVILRHAAL
jgi:hypothetical protein